MRAGAGQRHPPRRAPHACSTKTLVDQPLMQQVLADMALDVEAATALAFRLARSFDRAEDPRAAAWRAADDAGRPSTGSARWRRRWSTRRWSASAATATSRRRRWRGSIARCRSTPSGKAPATSWRSTCCACCSASPRPSQIVMEELAAPPATMRTCARACAARSHAAGAEAARCARHARWSRRWRVLAAGNDPAGARAACRRRCIHCDAHVRLSAQTYGQGLERADVRAIIARASPHHG